MKRLLAVSAVAVATTIASSGATLSATLSFSGVAFACNANPPFNVCNTIFPNETFSSSKGSITPQPVSQSVSSPDGIVTVGLGASGSASVSFGSLSLNNGASTGIRGFTGGNQNTSASITSTGNASFSDDLFVDTGLGSGTIQYSVSLRGQPVSSNLNGNATALFSSNGVSVIGGPSSDPPAGCTGGGAGVVSFSCIVNVPFRDGVAIPISGQVTGGTTGVSPNATSSTGSASGSVFLSSITVLNSDGAPISNFDWSSASGASSYNFVGGTDVNVPEPGGLMLTFSALFLLAGRCVVKSLPLRRQETESK